MSPFIRICLPRTTVKAAARAPADKSKSLRVPRPAQNKQAENDGDGEEYGPYVEEAYDEEEVSEPDGEGGDVEEGDDVEDAVVDAEDLFAEVSQCPCPRSAELKTFSQSVIIKRRSTPAPSKINSPLSHLMLIFLYISCCSSPQPPLP